jgi:hypothetical protein
MSSIFISYSRYSETIVKTLTDDIEALGHTVWLDKELKGGQAWWDQILGAVRDCDVFLFVLDPKALNSTACKHEYGYATALGKPILPVLVAEGVSTTLLPPALSQIQFVDYRKQDRAAALRLGRAIATVPPPKPVPDPLPPPPEVPISYLGRLSEQIETTPTLSYEQQSGLVVDLKRSLRDPEIAEDGYALLTRLRKRRDLFATIAEEIDELVTKTPEEPGQVNRQKGEAVSDALDESERRPDGTQHNQYLSMEQTTTKRNRTATPRERVIGAIVGSFVGLIVGFVAVNFLQTVDLAFVVIPVAGGAISGAISGTRQLAWVGVCLGGASGWFLTTIGNAGDSYAFGIAGIFGAPPGAILGAIVAKLVSKRASFDLRSSS